MDGAEGGGVGAEVAAREELGGVQHARGGGVGVGPQAKGRVVRREGRVGQAVGGAHVVELAPAGEGELGDLLRGRGEGGGPGVEESEGGGVGGEVGGFDLRGVSAGVGRGGRCLLDAVEAFIRLLEFVLFHPHAASSTRKRTY